MARPCIGITVGTGRTFKWTPGGPTPEDRTALYAPGGRWYEPYAEVIRSAGGSPHRLAPEEVESTAVLDRLDGLLLTGGPDVDLRLYPHPTDIPAGETVESLMARRKMTTEPERDRMELALARESVERDMPVLGICKGIQTLCVALGGWLVLDIDSELNTPVRHPARADQSSSHHDIRILSETRLASILDPDIVTRSTSRHHQAVRLDQHMPGVVAALCPGDDVVEAIEVPERRFVLGVQGHPESRREEDLEINHAHSPLFRAFVRVCGEV
jgi:putative glutamine amidotransferase